MFDLNKFLARWRDRIQAWKDRRRLGHELDRPGIGETERILRDIGLNMDDMAAITKPHAGPNVLLPQRLGQLGLDQRYIEAAFPATYHDLQRTCLRCTSWRQCARDLAANDTQAGLGHYCLNSEAIDTLLVGRGARP